MILSVCNVPPPATTASVFVVFLSDGVAVKQRSVIRKRERRVSARHSAPFVQRFGDELRCTVVNAIGKVLTVAQDLLGVSCVSLRHVKTPDSQWLCSTHLVYAAHRNLHR